MRRSLLVLVAAMLVFPASAVAKGPTKATVEGPGIAAITFSSYQGPTPNLTDITEDAGFFAAALGGQVPDPALPGRPEGDLGPKYTVTYEHGPGQPTIVQDVYPYADPPVTYMAPGQNIFDRGTRGGWLQAAPELKETLVAAGLPAAPPASASPSDGFSFPTVGASLLLLAAMSLVAATAVFLRRRPRKEPAT